MCSVVTKAEDTCLIHHNGHYYEDRSFCRPSAGEGTKEEWIEPVQGLDPSVIEKNITPIPHPIGSDIDSHETFPEGGARAWSVVFGSFCGLAAVFGVANAIAVFQQYISTHQLSNYSASQVAWIFSLGLFLTFFGGVQVGPIFDSKGPRVLLLAGRVMLFLSMMLLGECTGKSINFVDHTRMSS